MEEAQVKELDLQFETYKENIDKFSNSGNKAAGTRARKALAEMGKLTKAVRKAIQEAKNNESK
jgi:predicted oxidoreductase (fatty acid repression mutant protein)|tara:strand:- start:64 stop:252 length:189 start_codon:yes stop_codon:yes gene_type:complete